MLLIQKGQCALLVRKQQKGVYVLGVSLLFVTCQRCAILCLPELGSGNNSQFWYSNWFCQLPIFPLKDFSEFVGLSCCFQHCQDYKSQLSFFKFVSLYRCSTWNRQFCCLEQDLSVPCANTSLADMIFPKPLPISSMLAVGVHTFTKGKAQNTEFRYRQDTRLLKKNHCCLISLWKHMQVQTSPPCRTAEKSCYTVEN